MNERYYPSHAASPGRATKNVWTVQFAGENDFVLRDERGAIVATGPNPRRLVDRAFESGADEVRHEYDLKRGEP